MLIETNKALVRRYMEAGFAAGELSVLDETFSPAFLDHNGFAYQQPSLAEEGVSHLHALPDMGQDQAR